MAKIYRSFGTYDPNLVSVATGLRCTDESKTVQSAKEECDINTIVRRFGVTGTVPQGVRTPAYGDFEDIFDYQSAQNALLSAEQSFMAMPAHVRARFENDPAQFVDYCTAVDSNGALRNLEEMRKLGLAVPAKPSDSASEASS